MFTPQRAFSLLALITLFFFQCEQAIVEVPTTDLLRKWPARKVAVTNAEPINFCAMAVGQQVRYQRFYGYQYADQDVYDNYIYLNDTLVVEIVAEDEQGFLVEEYYTLGSEIRNGGEQVFAVYPDSTLRYYLQLSNDTLQIGGADGSLLQSRIFYDHDFYLGQFSGEAEILGWKTSLPYSESYNEAMVNSWTLFGQEYINLRLVVDNHMMAFDGPGFTFVYHPTDGLVRSVIYSWWTQEGAGHDLLPQ